MTSPRLLRSVHARHPQNLALAAVALSLAAATLSVLIPGASAHADAPVTINLLDTNDFHGRIDTNTVKWAWEIQHLRDPAVTPSNGQLLLSGGDNFGASLLASALEQDQPTIDVMNEIGVQASAVGNHEFDKGWPDLRDRVIGGDPNNPTNVKFPYLGANVYAKGTTTPVLPPYRIFDVAGVSVGVIGAVTTATPSLVNPAGMQNITIGNAAAAINNYARQLSDGDPTNGEAQVIVAEVHAGAINASPTFDQAQGHEFAQLANLDPSVNVILEGHTHELYAYDAPVSGGDLPTRPILQTGSFGSHIGQVLITVDPATGRVLSASAQNVPVNRSRTAEQDIAEYPSVLSPINDTVNAALANAAQVGGTAVGSITGPITTAYSGGSYVNGHYTGGVRDDRASESTLGDLVANALRDGPTSTAPHADLGLVSPQSLRAELAAGAVTYDEANNVLPFTSNVWTVQLTGAQLWQVLEEQWPPGDGAPSPALGLSDNVRVTADPSHPQGSRITSVRIDGHPLDPARTYLVSTFSYMVNGGSFPALGQGKSTSFGLIDRDIWFRYLSTHPGLAPDFDRHQVTEHGMPQGSVKAGHKVRFTLGNLNLTSQGSPANQHVDVYLNSPKGSRRVGTFPVHAARGGSATIAFKAPAKLPAPSTLTAVAQPSNTLIGADPGSTVAIKKVRMAYGSRHQVKVVVRSPLRGVPLTGRVTLRLKGKKLASHTLRHGRALFAIPRGLKPGRYPLRAKYAGDAKHAAAVGRAKLKVTKAKPRLGISRSPRSVSVGHGVTLGVRLSAPGPAVRGRVRVVADGHTYLAKLHHGSVAVKLRAFHSQGRKKVVVTYLGNAFDHRVTHVEHLRVT